MIPASVPIVRAVVVVVVVVVVAVAVLGACRKTDAPPKAEKDAGADADSLASPPPREGWSAVALARTHACALHENGRVACWSSAEKPVAWVDGVSGATSLAVLGDAYCARDRKQQVVCWGSGPWGVDGPRTETKATPVAHLSRLKPISSPNVDYACAIDAGERLLCWGKGHVGTGEDAGPRPYAVATTSILSKTTAAALSASHACAIDAAGQVMCWGDASDGKLGDGDVHDRDCKNVDQPRDVERGSHPYNIVECKRPEPFIEKPIVANGISGAIGIAVSYNASCAIVAGGRVMCWGRGYETKPKDMGIVGALEIAGNGLFCVRDAARAVTCFGQSDGWFSETPKRVDELDGARSIAVNGVRACAVLERGVVRCYGREESTGTQKHPLDDWTSRRP